MKKIFHIFLILPLILSGCIEGQIDEVRSELESVKNTEIASLEKQINEVSSSIGNLKNLSQEMKSYISNLDKLKTELETQLSDLNTKLDNVKKDFNSELTASENEVKKQLELAQSGLEKTIAGIETTIGVLKEKDASLEKKIADLKTYSDGTFATKEWAEATYATLESQNALIDDITLVKAQIKALDVSIGNIEHEILELIEDEIAEAKKGLDEELANKVSNLTSQYKQYISKIKQLLNSQIESQIISSIEASEEKILSWVNDQLKSYYTVAQAKAQVEAMMSVLGNVPAGKNLQGELEALASDLEEAIKTIIEDYQKLIESAISTSEGKITEEMGGKIDDLENNVIAPLTDRVNTLEGEVQKLWNEINSFVDRVNTLDQQIAAINESLAVLDELKMTLKEYVEGVQKALEDADTKNYNELKGLIDNLHKLLNDSDPSSLQSQYNALKDFVGTIPSGETSIVSWVENTKKAIDEQFKLYATIEYVNGLKTQFETLLDDQDDTISEFNEKLSTIIEDNKELICTWIDAKLADYWTSTELKEEIAELKGKLKGLIESEDDELSNQIKDIEQAIKDAETTLESEYKEVISKAITDNNAIITKTIADAFKEKADQVTALSGRIDVVGNQIDGLKQEVDDLDQAVQDLRTDLDAIQNFIKESGITALQPFIDEIQAAIDDCPNKYADLAEFTAFKELVESLQTQVEQLDEIEGRIGDAEELSEALDAFLRTGFDDDDTLVDILAAINTELGILWDDVFGVEGETDSLQDMIDAINAALYGEGGTKDNPVSNSLYAQLKAMCDKIVICKFASVAYVPDNDTRTAKFIKVNDVYKATLNFEVRPQSLATLLANSNACKMVYVETLSKSVDLKTFDSKNVSYSGTDAGMFTVTITVESLDFIKSVPGICTALCVDLTTEDDPRAANFTSSFVPLSY